MNDDMITITVAEYERLVDGVRFLECLQHAGVDNWDGYDFALEEYKEGST